MNLRDPLNAASRYSICTAYRILNMHHDVRQNKQNVASRSSYTHLLHDRAGIIPHETFSVQVGFIHCTPSACGTLETAKLGAKA